MNAEFNDDRTLEEVRSLMETLRGLIGLEEGQLYTLRRGLLHHVRGHDDEDALRRVRIMEDAYNAAYALARGLRKHLRGYRPDPALVISALVLHAVRQPDAPAIVQDYLQTLFSHASVNAESAEDVDNASRVGG